MRAFFAVALTPPVIEALAGCREALLAADPSWRGEKWVADENLHITMLFLGDVPQACVEDILTAVRGALGDVRAFCLTFGRIAATPRPRTASMIWAAPTAGDAECASLAQRIEAAVTKTLPTSAGMHAGVRPFRAHVTLCRTRRPRRILDGAIERASERLRGRPLTMSVGEVTLFASTLTRSGPVYEVAGTVPLQS